MSDFMSVIKGSVRGQLVSEQIIDKDSGQSVVGTFQYIFT